MYTLQSSKIGEGTYGSVAIGTHNSTKAQRAIKTMSKANMHLDGNNFSQRISKNKKCQGSIEAFLINQIMGTQTDSILAISWMVFRLTNPAVRTI